MINIIPIIPARFINQVEKDLGASAVLALKRLDKIATAKTAKSIRTESDRNKVAIEIAVVGGESLKYIIDGKPPNTKMPVRKVGSKFELIQEVKDWKAVRGFRGPDFLLARAIAKNEQKPNDVAGLTLEIFNELYGDKISNQLLSFYAESVGEGLTNID